jgi:GNAT superfamily N-acetyltransferase
VQILTFPEAETPPRLWWQALDLAREAWPAFADVDPGHDPTLFPLLMLVVEDENVLAGLSLLHKEIVHCGQSYMVGGLSTIATRKSAQGRGLGRRIVTAAHQTLAESGLDLSIFSSERALVPFYESAGWHEVPGAVLVGGTPEQPLPTDLPGWDRAVLADFFTDKARSHKESFEHSRIELYPGEIDRLW